MLPIDGKFFGFYFRHKRLTEPKIGNNFSDSFLGCFCSGSNIMSSNFWILVLFWWCFLTGLFPIVLFVVSRIEKSEKYDDMSVEPVNRQVDDIDNIPLQPPGG
jgi:hypothetical protein